MYKLPDLLQFVVCLFTNADTGREPQKDDDIEVRTLPQHFFKLQITFTSPTI